MERKTPGSGSPINEDPRRIAACVAACEGIPTQALEDGVILKLVAACVHLKDPRVHQILQSFGGLTQRQTAKLQPPRKPGD